MNARQGSGDASSADALRRVADGDAAALDALVVRHYALVRAFLRLRVDAATRLRESVSDLVQSVCREVLARADRFEFRGEEAFRAWLCEAALRKLRDRRDHHHAACRDPAREAAAAAELAETYRTTLDPLGRAIRGEEVERLEAAVGCLPEVSREVLTLRYLCGLAHGEIAARTGRSETAVRQQVSRARARLAELIAAGTAPGQ